jgi:hypothetical protein
VLENNLIITMPTSYLAKEAIAQNDNNNHFLRYTNPTYGIKCNIFLIGILHWKAPLLDVKETRG